MRGEPNYIYHYRTAPKRLSARMIHEPTDKFPRKGFFSMKILYAVIDKCRKATKKLLEKLREDEKIIKLCKLPYSIYGDITFEVTLRNPVLMQSDGRLLTGFFIRYPDTFCLLLFYHVFGFGLIDRGTDLPQICQNKRLR